MNTGQFYFSRDKLEEMLKLFSSPEFQKLAGDRKFRGLVFTPGNHPDGSATAFAFPLFGDPSAMTGVAEPGAVLYSNTDPRLSGCPYPPGCP